MRGTHIRAARVIPRDTGTEIAAHRLVDDLLHGDGDLHGLRDNHLVRGLRKETHHSIATEREPKTKSKKQRWRHRQVCASGGGKW